MVLAPSPRFDLVHDWEQLPGQFVHRDVADVAIDSQDRVYLFVRHDFRVLVYAADGTFLHAWGDAEFVNSHAITIGPDDSVYCTDNGNHTVRKYTPDGKLLMVLGTPGVPSDTGYVPMDLDTIVRCGGPFNACTDVAVGPDGDLYVSDGYGNARIHHFSAGGDLLQSWGEPGTGPGQFHLPHGIAISAEGRLVVADRENDRLQFFDLDGAFIEEWTNIRRPSSVHFDADGLLYVAELWRWPGQRSYVHGVATEDQPGRVSVLAPDGEVLTRWGDSEDRCAPGNFVAPHGISVDSRGDVYVAEVTWTLAGRLDLVSSECHQIQKFQRTAPPVRN
jgi:DNA-binding beta-propeller fold protein YncE